MASKKIRVLVNKDGRVLVWTETLSKRADMTPGWLENGTVKLDSVKPVTIPEPPKVEDISGKIPKEEIAPANVGADEPETEGMPELTPEKLDGMTKGNCYSFAAQHLGLSLNMKETAEALRTKLWDAYQAKVAETKTQE